MNQPNEGMRERFDEIFVKGSEVGENLWVRNGMHKICFYDFINQEIDLALAKQRSELVEIIKNRIEETKIKKRETSFQDTLFNYEVNVLDDIISTITKDTKD